jgi:hypothetical protein
VDGLVGRLVARPVLVITSAVLECSFRGTLRLLVGSVGWWVTGVARLVVAVAGIATAGSWL